MVAAFAAVFVVFFKSLLCIFLCFVAFYCLLQPLQTLRVRAKERRGPHRGPLSLLWGPTPLSSLPMGDSRPPSQTRHLV